MPSFRARRTGTKTPSTATAGRCPQICKPARSGRPRSTVCRPESGAIVTGQDAGGCRRCETGLAQSQRTAHIRLGLGAGAGSSSSNPVRASTWRRMVSKRCSTFSEVRAEVSTSLHPMSAASSRPSASVTCWALRIANRVGAGSKGEREGCCWRQLHDGGAPAAPCASINTRPAPCDRITRPRPRSHPPRACGPNSKGSRGRARPSSSGAKLTSLAEDRSCSPPPRAARRPPRWLQATYR